VPHLYLTLAQGAPQHITMNVIPTDIPDVILLEPQVFPDTRGFFMETYHARRLAELGIVAQFVQDNHSRSQRGTLRGLHYQIRQSRGKLGLGDLGPCAHGSNRRFR
jgi:dTDP-4-dehydrorhamnose 3,5-epimerase